MLTLDINFSRLSTKDFAQQVLRRVQIFASPYLEHYLIRNRETGGYALIIREIDSRSPAGRFPPQMFGQPQLLAAADYDLILARAREWRRSLLLFEILDGDKPAVRLYCGESCSCPLYALWQNGQLQIGWDPARLIAQAHMLVPDVPYITSALIMQDSLSSQTYFRNLNQLPNGGTLTASMTGMQIAPPEPAAVPGRHELRPETDIIDVFDQLLRQAVATPFTDSPDRLGSELSGGLDSAAVTLALRRNCPRAEIKTLAVGILPHAAAVQQARRRAEFCRLFGADDFMHPTTGSVITARGPGDTGFEEPAHDDFQILARHLRHQQVDIVFNGLGGDELFMKTHPIGEPPPPSRGELEVLAERALFPVAPAQQVRAREVRRWPARHVSASTIECSFHSIIYMREGIWSVMPLLDRDLATLTYMIPEEWRKDRRLLRAWLERAGLSTDFLHPQLEESFAPVLENSRPALLAMAEQYTADSLLIEMGIVAPVRLQRLLVACRSSKSDVALNLLFRFVRTEWILQSAHRRGALTLSVAAA